MSVKNTLAIGLTVVGLAVGAAQALEPKTAAEQQRQQQEQRISDAADADGKSKDTMRDQGNSAAEANQRDKLNPTEPRPGEKPKIKIKMGLK
ncbi:MAG: hypothetical protein IPM08_01410 [Actinomycetales bacterium]|nr:hypothetical protein [Actinomycetales bacterium]